MNIICVNEKPRKDSEGIGFPQFVFKFHDVGERLRKLKELNLARKGKFTRR